MGLHVPLLYYHVFYVRSRQYRLGPSGRVWPLLLTRVTAGLRVLNVLRQLIFSE